MNQNPESDRPQLDLGQQQVTAGGGDFSKRKTWLRRFYRGGLVIFLASRFLGIWGGYFTGETPRNGADALTYIFRGHLCLQGYPPALASVQSIKQQLADNPTPFRPDGQSFSRFILTRIQGTATPLYDLVLGSVHALVGDAGLAYALTESLTAILLAAGAGCFLKRLVGWRAAGLALTAMAVIILPRQGIDTLIATLAATGLTLWISGALLRAGRPSWGWITAGAVSLAFVHTIGVVYLVYLCALAAMISWRRHESLFKGRAAWFTAIAATAVVLRLLLFAFLPGMTLAQEYHGVAQQLSQFGGNAERAFRFIYDVLRKNLAVLLLLIVAVGGLRRRFFTPRVRWIFMAWGLVSAATLLHHLPGFKADLFGRVLVVGVFALCGVAARVFYQRSTSWWLRAAACALFALQISRWVGLEIGEHLHFHWYAFDLDRAGEVLKQQQPAEKLLFVEGEQTLQAMLLAGCENKEVIWLPAYDNEPQPWKVATERDDWVGIVAPPRELNCLAMIRPQGFSRRREGVSFNYCPAIQIEAQDHRELPALTFSFRSTDRLDQMRFIPYDKDGNRMALNALTTQQSSSGRDWAVAGSGIWRLDIMLPEADNWLEGFRESALNTGLRWPWNSGLIMRYAARGMRASPMYTVDFNLSHALQQQAAVNLPPPPFAITPVDDSSGFIFYRRQTTP